MASFGGAGGDASVQAAGALANPKIREMLERFRSEGPQVLQEYADDPSVRSVLGSLAAPQPSLPVLPPNNINMPTHNSTVPVLSPQHRKIDVSHHQTEYKNDDYDYYDDNNNGEASDDDFNPLSMLSAPRNTNLTQSFPVRGNAYDMMMQLDGEALDKIEYQYRDTRHSEAASVSQEPITVSTVLLDVPDHDPSYINDMRLKAGTEFTDKIDNTKKGEVDRPLRLVIGVGDGESLSLLSKIITKCCGADCRIKVSKHVLFH
jgi:hypothetical protein